MHGVHGKLGLCLSPPPSLYVKKTISYSLLALTWDPWDQCHSLLYLTLSTPMRQKHYSILWIGLSNLVVPNLLFCLSIWVEYEVFGISLAIFGWPHIKHTSSSLSSFYEESWFRHVGLLYTLFPLAILSPLIFSFISLGFSSINKWHA